MIKAEFEAESEDIAENTTTESLENQVKNRSNCNDSGDNHEKSR